MGKNKKIAIVAPYSFGYIDFVVERLNDTENVDLTYINFDEISFTYKNTGERIANFFRKLFSLPNLKDLNKTNFIFNSVSIENRFDQILVIRPDKLQMEALSFLRGKSSEMICYLFDGIQNFKNQHKTLSYFDTIYSYDRLDADKYGFEFLPNYIYDEQINVNPVKYKVFNISSYDKRFPLLEQLATYLTEKGISFRFIVKKDKMINHPLIEFTNKYIPLEEVKKYISESSVLIDVQKERQFGLSFRVFEALGYRKKIITNNPDIVNYDFYNPNNVFVITEENKEIPLFFFGTPYEEIPDEILNKYRLKTWIHKVFNI